MGHETGLAPNPWMVVPFGVLLASIALGPLWFSPWWSRHYPKVAVGLGSVTVAYYLVGLHAPGRLLGVAHEYVSFIALIGSLFVVSGGIHLTVKGEATPWANTVFLGVGAIVANLLGTTGASMVLIRPWLRMNKYRVTAHHVVFFIFIVSNVGGGLTPIGDPPLFLGYLKGVPFWWVAEACWPMWLVAVGALLAVFYTVDRRNYLRAPVEVRQRLAEGADRWRFEGMGNVGWLAVILGAVFIERPLFLREVLMVGAAVASYYTTRPSIHSANQFNFHPIREVAILFVGIFATMIPALDWLERNAGGMGQPTPALFYWATGSLSTVLDNAPTYLSFLSAAIGSCVRPELVEQVTQALAAGGGGAFGTGSAMAGGTLGALREYFGSAVAQGGVTAEQVQVAALLGNPELSRLLVAISTGAVFFGAGTYIGNGPNFMVKAIAEEKQVHTPTFLGYVVRFTLPYLLPVLALVGWLFFRTST